MYAHVDDIIHIRLVSPSNYCFLAYAVIEFSTNFN